MNIRNSHHKQANFIGLRRKLSVGYLTSFQYKQTKQGGTDSGGSGRGIFMVLSRYLHGETEKKPVGVANVAAEI